MNEKARLLADLNEYYRRQQFRARDKLFPESGELARQYYPKHMEFFKRGLDSDERCFMAANRVGKTVCGGFETALHVEGNYPDWWPGTRFDGPIDAWVCGKTNETVRDILQSLLLGPVDSIGTGLIRGDLIVRKTGKRGISDAIEKVYVRHSSGGVSCISFKSYIQGRSSFEGQKKDLIWNDEEPPLDVYSEQLLRTASTIPGESGGIMLNTFTPLEGMSDVVLSFLPGGNPDASNSVKGGKCVIQCGWEDVPHLPEEEKKRLYLSIPPYQREARMHGTPQLGSGAIYPIDIEELLIEPFDIPPHFAKGYGLDVGWNATAAVWGALDRDTDVLYLYHEYKRGQAEPASHVDAIQAPGRWIKGAIDPASNGRSQADGKKLKVKYEKHGLNLINADNSVEAGIFEVYSRMATGRLKIFKTLRKTQDELRLYRRNNSGKIVKENDHLMDAKRYLVNTLLRVVKTEPVAIEHSTIYGKAQSNAGWMGV